MIRGRVFSGQRGLIVAIFVLSLCVNLLVLTAPIYMIQLFMRVMPSGSLSTLAALTVGAVICLGFFFLFDTIRQRLTARMGARIEANLGPAVLYGLVTTPELRESMGSRPVADVSGVSRFVSGPYFTTLLDAPWAVVFLALIYLFHPILGLIATTGIVILFVIALISEMSGRAPSKLSEDAGQKANTVAEEALRNADILRAMGQAPDMVRRWQARSVAAMIFGVRVTDRIATATSLAKSLRQALQIAVLGSGVVLVIAGQLNPGLMIAASILLGRAAAPVEQSIAGWRALIEVRQKISRLEFVLGHVEAEAAKLELPEPEGRLSVENATVVMPGVQDPTVFDVSFQLEPGSSLGIIGPSGAGKTTLLRAIAGLQPLGRGHVRIDDAALSDWPMLQIGRAIGYLPQSVELFEGTVAENIAMMTEEADPAEVVTAAKAAEVHEMILNLPEGYNTQVGPRGLHLSAGQRQRIGLARAFYGQRRIIVLDEPNANLDPAGEEALARAVENATDRGAVVILVTHRMNILSRLSHAAIMERGRMVRIGTSRTVLDALAGPMAGQSSGSNVAPFRLDRRMARDAGHTEAGGAGK